MQRLRLHIVLLLFCACGITGHAQEATANPLAGLPSTAPIVDYDPESGNYLYYYSYDTRKTMPYKVQSTEEYRREQFLNSLRQGWDKQRNLQSGTGGLGQNQDGNMIPTSFSINSDVFKKVFGSNEISVNPQGNIDLNFGINHNYTDNPIIPIRYRGSTNFDFDIKMMFNVDASIGDRIKLNWDYNTEATFDFETNFKIEYVGNEDDILQKIEAGNVNLPLDGTLITGNQSLFGIKTALRFGKLDVTTIFSRQDAETETVEIQGGGQSNVFEIAGDKYDANRHFFLNQYFRDHYDQYLSRLPLILSGINITRVEVWVTNKSARFADSRNLVAFMDLGEADVIYNAKFTRQHGGYPDSASNNLLAVVNTSELRNLSNVTGYLDGIGLKSGEDFEKLENARRLNTNEYTINTQLGYISLNQALNNDEVLAVAYEYEAGGITYQVGEISTDGIVAPNTLVLKLLKGTTLSPKLPTWKLMMKNIYSLDSYSISAEDFMMDVYYENSEAGTALPYIAEGKIANKPLLRVLNLDNLNGQQDAYPDGVFDFVEGVTVLASKGKIIFPVLEPFGRYLEKQLADPALAEKYAFKELYDSTLVKARMLAEKNRFKLIGNYVSEGGGEIRLNATNIPQGSVVVTAGGIQLQENVDYEVDYMLGTVRILNQAYLESGTPLRVSLENRQQFNMQTKTLIGTNLKYRFSDDFYVGATILNLSERPLTQKVNLGNEAISNTIWGVNTAFRMDAPLITKGLNFLPFYNTKESSSIAFDAEFAQFLPGHSGAIGASGGTIFIDDFESSETSLDLRSVTSWTLAGTPQGQPALFSEAGGVSLRSGFNRARLAWYSIYSEFLHNSGYTPAYIRNDPARYQENHFVREVPIREIFPEQDEVVGTLTTLPVFNMAFYPDEKGPYNYDSTNVSPDGKLLRPQERWGGVMRSLPVTDFETANYDYVEFWLMDPFVYNPDAKGGKFYINLGDVSEDILKDGLKSFENGLPPFEDTARYENTIWGRVPKVQSLTQTFDNDYAARAYQDVGMDGLDDAHEYDRFNGYLNRVLGIVSDPAAKQKISNDPSGDNYVYYLDDFYDQQQASILDRYKYYNNMEGNSTPRGSDNSMGTTLPDMEDINRDYTMNESENYYQYEIDINPNALRVGENYITDSRTVPVNFPNNGASEVTWYQFKVPINEGRAIGAIQDLKSIRFIRMFMRGFNDTTIMRFAVLKLVRGDWRRYTQSLLEGQESMAQPELTNAVFDITSVNIEENATRTPVNYVLPPGTSRQIDPGQYQVRQLNEQSMQLKVVDLADGDGRAAYKNTTFDFRQYKRLKMDVHAEAIDGFPLRDNEVSMFIRVGTDFRYNYYEYEIPLSVTPPGFYYDNQRDVVWPEGNRFDVDLEVFTKAKLERNALMKSQGGSMSSVFEKRDGKNIIRVVGNPNLGGVRTLMIGIRNPAKRNNAGDDGLSKSAVIWADELRLTNFDESPGYAANARVSAKLADLGNVTIAGNMMTPNFGSLEAKIADRSMVQMYQYDIASNLELGKFFPERLGIQLPFFFGFMENYTTPKYNPFDQDILYKDALNNLPSYERDSLRRMVRDFKQRMAVNFTNVRVGANATEQRIFHPSNLSLSFSYNRLLAHNSRLDHQVDQNYHFNLGYAYNVEPHTIDILKNVPWLRSRYLRLINELNINPYPNSFTFNTDINRSYNEIQYRTVAAPDVVLPATAAKDFTWDRSYNMLWDITRSIKLDFSANNRARIDEPEGIVNKRTDPESYRHWYDSTWTNFWNMGRNVQYFHDYNLTWTVPINKIPFMEWTNATLRYGGGYDWQAAPLLNDDSYDPGNTITNLRNINPQLTFNMESLYNKSPFLQKINDEFSGRARRRPEMVDVSYESPKMNFRAKQRRTLKHKLGTEDVKVQLAGADGRVIKAEVIVVDKNTVTVVAEETVAGATAKVSGRVPKKENPWSYAGKVMVRLAMTVRNVMISYSGRDVTTVPGFKPNSQLMGMNFNDGWAPGWGFVFGGQDEDFVEKARRNLWLSGDTTIISPFRMEHTNTWSFRATLEPVRQLLIELTAKRGYTENLLTYNIAQPSKQRQVTGSFNISVLTLATAFERPTVGNDYYSKAFRRFLQNRPVISQRLGVERAAHMAAQGHGYTGAVNEQGYADGFGPLSPEVLIPSFLSAYTGRSAEKVTLSNFLNIPLPNWQISYDGLSRIAALKEVVTSFTLTHSYQSTYAVYSYMRNQKYDEGDDGFAYVRNTLNDFIPQRDLTNISIDERFMPLSLNIGWYNALSTHIEWKRERRISLSMANNQLSELRTNNWSIGAGYTFREFPVIFKFLNNRSTQTSTTLRLSADLSLSDDLNILRRITDDNTDLPQVSDGKNAVTIKCSADYVLSNSITLRLFFDRVVNTPRVSTVRTANTSAGFSVNLSLAQ